MVYKFKQGGRFPISAQVAGEAIEEIKGRDGNCTPQAVVDAARSPASPFHPCFDFADVSAAANSWWVHEARHLINNIVVEIVGKPGEPPISMVAFVSVDVPVVGRGYLPIAEIMSDEALKDQAIAEALKVLEGWQRRYAGMAELKGIFAAIKKVRAKLEKVKT